MVTNIGALRSASYGMLLSVSAGDREYFPVNANQYVYSQFKYVGGTPVDDGSGITITQLKILDSILEQLVTMQRDNADSGLNGADLKFLTDEISEQQLSEIVIHYQRELQAAAERLENEIYKPSMPETGVLFNMLG